MLYAILILALVVLDQVVKFLVRAHIPLGGSLPFLPHILELTYVQNTGAAFSVLSQHTWLLTIVSAVVAAPTMENTTARPAAAFTTCSRIFLRSSAVR